MLPLKTLLYLFLFGLAVFGAVLYHPLLGIYAYLGTYNINPVSHWWGNYVPDFASRYSLILVLATTAGVILHNYKLKFENFLERQEVLLLLFLAIIWFSVLVGQGAGTDYNVYKMSKLVFVLFLASHLITSFRSYEGMLWVLIIAGFYLGYEMFLGSGSFRGGRFDVGVGGSDFAEGNFLAAHFAFLLPLIGVLFLKGDRRIKGVCLFSAVFILNAFIITRSRGAFLGLAVGMVAALFFSNRLKEYRKKIVFLMIVGGLGAVFLTDPGFWGRMSTIQGEDTLISTSGTSVEGRLTAWRAAWAMFQDHPLGVGVGEFFRFVGRYEPTIPGKDTHNTYLRCLAELGFQGFILLMLLIGNAFLTLRNVDRAALNLPGGRHHDYHLHAFALKIALVIYLCAAMFITSVYIEEFYWLLFMPLFLKRAVQNELREAESARA